jgi:hypothetical protein
MNELRLSPDEAAEFLATAERLDGFVDGARALAESIKSRRLKEIVAARQAPKPKEESHGTEA